MWEPQRRQEQFAEYKPNDGSAEKLNAVFTPEVNVKQVLEAMK